MTGREAGLERLRRALRAEGLDAYLAYTPSNVLYVSGYESYFLSRWWRMLGTVLALVPADDSPPALVVSDFEEPAARSASGWEDVRSYPLWVESRALEVLRRPDTALHRPAQHRQEDIDARVRELLVDRGLATARIGSDLRYMLAHSAEHLAAAAPGVDWVDATDLLYRVRAVKQPWEVERLRRATELSEAGMRWAAEHLREGLTAADVGRLYSQGVLEAALGDPRYADHTDEWVIPSVGGAVSPSQAGPPAGLRAGDLVKFDCGTTVGGYRSDGGRTFAFRHASDAARRLHATLEEAHAAARERVKPGEPVAAVFAAAQEVVRRSGYPGYSRGHVGHSVGIDTFHEEPPYLSPEDPGVLEPGMVLAVETPFYGHDVGAIMIEDLIHVTEEGHEVLHTLPHELTVVGEA